MPETAPEPKVETPAPRKPSERKTNQRSNESRQKSSRGERGDNTGRNESRNDSSARTEQRAEQRAEQKLSRKLSQKPSSAAVHRVQPVMIIAISVAAPAAPEIVVVTPSKTMPTVKRRLIKRLVKRLRLTAQPKRGITAKVLRRKSHVAIMAATLSAKSQPNSRKLHQTTASRNVRVTTRVTARAPRRSILKQKPSS